MKYTGVVVSAKMKDTVVVEREISRMHPLYQKIIRSTRRVKAHTDMPLLAGDKVRFVSTRPLSKEKHFKVVEKI